MGSTLPLGSCRFRLGRWLLPGRLALCATVNDIKNRTGKLLDSQDEVGGWPKLKSKPASKDADRDGMADAWEKANNLDPKNPADRNGDTDKDGYTNLEEYLNSLCPQLKE